ncbi:MAG: SRPBCC domain-containing protein [Myxococcota bacterium]|nr:SRPBCC domain-containing protein [Myxococcota bacterium]
MIEIEESCEVMASASVLWQVITDFDRYPEWNPFVISCAADLQEGQTINMKVQLFKHFAQPQREIILEVNPGRSFRYGLPSNRLGALASCRSHEVQPRGAQRSHYRSHFQLQGWLAPLTQALLGRRLEHGFRSMTQALVAHAESRAAQQEPDR